MTNQVAAVLFVLIAGIFALDFFWLEQDLLVKSGKLLDRAIDYLSFWR